jgi:hypothetical protein
VLDSTSSRWSAHADKRPRVARQTDNRAGAKDGVDGSALEAELAEVGATQERAGIGQARGSCRERAHLCRTRVSPWLTSSSLRPSRYSIRARRSALSSSERRPRVRFPDRQNPGDLQRERLERQHATASFTVTVQRRRHVVLHVTATTDTGDDLS